jgi:hypothetical protein
MPANTLAHRPDLILRQAVVIGGIMQIMCSSGHHVEALARRYSMSGAFETTDEKACEEPGQTHATFSASEERYM